MLDIRALMSMNKIERALSDLPDNVNDIVSVFRLMGIRGIPKDVLNCIVARYLTQVTGIPVIVFGMKVNLRPSLPRNSEIALPRAVADVVHMFDYNEWPDLMEEAK